MATPDEDVYVEGISHAHNADLSGSKLGPVGGGIASLNGGATYDFPGLLSTADTLRLLEESYDVAHGERLAQGLEALPPLIAGTSRLQAAPAPTPPVALVGGGGGGAPAPGPVKGGVAPAGG